MNNEVTDSDKGNSSTLPAMSVVVVTPDHYQTIETTMLCLRRQTVCHSLEIVIVAPSQEQLELKESELSSFFSYTVVEAGPIESIGRANALGVRHSSAPIVAMTEDHCFPDDGWAALLIDAHQGPWAAVGPAVRNANPDTSVSWADLFIGYGIWLTPTLADTDPGPRDGLLTRPQQQL